jgi:hypothetical protein
MNYRLSTLFERKAYSADATEVIDINVKDPISQLIIELAANITDDTAITAHAIACLKKIELVDGSDVLFALSGYEAEAVDWYHNHVIRSPWDIYMGWGETQRFIGINFGRYLWDPILSFDPTKFRNPQLKLTIDIDAGGAVPNQNRLAVWAAMFDQKTVTPAGFLMHKEIKDYTMASASHEYTDIPTDYPIRKMFVRSQYPEVEPGQIINTIKLSEDQDKRIIFDHQAEQILRTMAYMSPPIQEHIHARVAVAATHIYCTPTARCYAIGTELGDTSGSGNIATTMGDGGRFHAYAETAQKYAQFFVRGWLPHGTYELPFGNPEDIEDWFDVTKVGSLKADILSVSGITSSYSTQIFLQQLRKYGA